jgi:hypothetical protein
LSSQRNQTMHEAKNTCADCKHFGVDCTSRNVNDHCSMFSSMVGAAITADVEKENGMTAEQKSDNGVRYCPACGKPDSTDWQSFGVAKRYGWVTAGSLLSCDICGEEFPAAQWLQQTEPPSPLPQVSKSSGTFREAIEGLVILLGLALCVGVLIGTFSTVNKWLTTPIYEKDFTFDRLAKMDGVIEDMGFELNNAICTKRDWRRTALLATGAQGDDTRENVLVMHFGNGSVVIFAEDMNAARDAIWKE